MDKLHEIKSIKSKTITSSNTLIRYNIVVYV